MSFTVKWRWRQRASCELRVGVNNTKKGSWLVYKHKVYFGADKKEVLLSLPAPNDDDDEVSLIPSTFQRPCRLQNFQTLEFRTLYILPQFPQTG